MSDLQVPQPTSKVVNFDQIKTFDQAFDYAVAGYHASMKSSQKAGPVGRLWKDAADAYYAAYLAMIPLRAIASDQAMMKGKELLHDANHKADIAKVGATAQPNA
jgi:hypothetical protein